MPVKIGDFRAKRDKTSATMFQEPDRSKSSHSLTGKGGKQTLEMTTGELHNTLQA